MKNNADKKKASILLKKSNARYLSLLVNKIIEATSTVFHYGRGNYSSMWEKKII
jgi:hypothetical protein